MENSEVKEQIRQQFVTICSELIWMFPELDLQFCHPGNTKTFRCLFQDTTKPAFELPLEIENSAELIQEASFRIKQLYQLYDA